MFKSCYEVVSVSKKTGEVVFRCTKWFNEDETLDRIEVGYAGLEIVRVSKVERSCKVTVKTNKEFAVGQKLSSDEFNMHALQFSDIKYGTYRKTGNVVGGTIENRVLTCDSDSGWDSDKIELDDVKKMIGFLNKMLETNS